MKLHIGKMPKAITETPVARKKAVVVKQKAAPRIPVSDSNLRKAAARLLPTSLVSVEVAYLQRQLATAVTQEELDRQVLAVRALPWASIAMPD